MPSVCFYFQVHQPYRLRKYTIFDIKHGRTDYFDETKNKAICQKVANKCYLPANKLMLDLIKKHKGAFRISYSISGVALEQFQEYAPEVLESFKALAKTNCVEFMAETYCHSLSYLYSKEEFKEQVKMHGNLIYKYFGQVPKVFRNTELIYNNELAMTIESMGYRGIVAEGADHILGWRSPNFIYHPRNCSKIALLLKNYRLSDDIAFRFSNRGWIEFPLSSEKYTEWINAVNGNGEVVNLFMDYETIGEHQWEDTGIFKFLEVLPEKVMANPSNNFKTVSEVINTYPIRGEMDIHNFISWADIERDLTAWLGNNLQKQAIDGLYELEQAVKSTGDLRLIDDWRKLTTSDHFYYMCTKWFQDGDVHKYFNPYSTPYDSFIIFMNVCEHLRQRLAQQYSINTKVSLKQI
ncbi:MAG: glycoside hydrolase family 57 protein [Candidatus Margulisbacteria bacterium]|nr:glycoside hydrolase family 57 protein [Candidatus Margulisiibacteriota bacterium]